MLGKIPITSLDDLGSINNINLLQLNNTFAKLYINDLFYQKLFTKIPKVYQNNKVYNTNDCIWLNTEYYREFIDFPLHAKHIIEDYNASPDGMAASHLSLDYDELSKKIIVSSMNGETVVSNYIDYDNKETCLSLMHYSYVVGDLTTSDGSLNSSILYKCNFDNVSGWVDLANETLPLKDRLSVWSEDGSANTLSAIRTLDECKQNLNYEKNSYPVWSVVYSNASEINYGWVSAYVRAALSVHAMIVSASTTQEGTIIRSNPIPSTNALGKMPAFPGDPSTLQVSAYVPGYETEGYSISPINDTLLSVEVKWSPTTPTDPISAVGNIGYYYKDADTYSFEKALMYNDSLSTDNLFFQHNVPNAEQYDEIERKYTSIDTMNVNLSSIWTCYDKETLAVKFNFDECTHLSNTFDFIICSNGKLRSDSNVNVWASGLVEAYGTNADYASKLASGVEIGDLGVKIKFNMTSAVQLTSSVGSQTTYYVSEYQDVSALIPLLSDIVPAINNYVVDYIRKE